MADQVAALDIGGTKIHAAVIDRSGQILVSERSAVRVSEGPKVFHQQLKEILYGLAKEFKFSRVGLACAGPLDGQRGELLDPTNFFTSGKSWGRFDLLGPLKSEFPSWKIFLENDAAAAVMAESWLDGGANVVAMTLGTGVGIGAIVDGTLVRSRDGLHPEISHIPVNAFAKDFPCGCGNNGCIEAFLAGRLTVQRLAKLWGEPKLSGEEIVRRAEAQEPQVLDALKQYGEWMAEALRALAVLYGPQKIVLSGGFAAAAPWFLDHTRELLPKLLERRRVGVDLLPEIRVSKLGDNLGILGAARVAFTY